MDTQALMDLCRINEEAKEFDLGKWSEDLHPRRTFFGLRCGTAGCLIGNFCLSNPDDRLKLANTDKWGIVPAIDGRPFCDTQGFLTGEKVWSHIGERFGISQSEASFLFNSRDKVRDSHGRIEKWIFRNCKNRDAAIRRVRKLIYYKMRKQEFTHEPDGRVRESARRMEGDRRFDRQVLEAVG